MAPDSGMMRLPSRGPVIRTGALPYGPIAWREGGERKRRFGIRRWVSIVELQIVRDIKFLKKP